MKKQFNYLPYSGVGAYAYIGCIPADESVAAEVADLLVSRGFRLSCDNCGGSFAQSPAAVAEAIARCSGAVIFLSKKSIESLAFRNVINYIFSLRKPFVCVKLGEFELGHGLDMQLANIPMISHTSAEQTAETLLQSGALMQSMVGEGMVQRSFNRIRSYIIISMIVAAVLIFALCVGAMIKERTSAAFVLQDTDGSSYVNISTYGDEGIAAMAGKTVGELDLSGGTYSSLSDMKNISASTVNVSGISPKISLTPLLQMNGLETVKLSQEQLIYAKDLFNSGLTVLVTQ